MGLNEEYIQKMWAATGCLPTATKTETPADTVLKLQDECRDKAWSLYYWVRLYLAYGAEYLPNLQEIVLEIQGLQDQLTEFEKSLAEEAE